MDTSKSRLRCNSRSLASASLEAGITVPSFISRSSSNCLKVWVFTLPANYPPPSQTLGSHVQIHLTYGYPLLIPSIQTLPYPHPLNRPFVIGIPIHSILHKGWGYLIFPGANFILCGKHPPSSLLYKNGRGYIF